MAALPRLESASLNAREALGWSNLVKINSVNIASPPGTEIIAAQAPLCVEALRGEVRVFRSHATVLLSGNYAQDEILLPVFGPAELFQNNVEAEDRVAIRNHPEFGPVISANHPQAMGSNYKSDIGFIAGCLTGLLINQLDLA